ncbi:SpoIIE family protein phosphatase [Mycobacterium sp.]|uniref:SpoIIE family protein phosphatase n=1 Tax=Mycobacterium sp. TaxID=1785 RepID=UPI00127C66A0|nr:SpoIIE family protein phosphatase [Mycobacterium sp.]KAA8963882.1 MAG: SpoIIE family protein phosphatase [Mycobacterium sp.]
MTNTADDFYVRYARALSRYLQTRDEATLAIGQELGRRALQDGISTLEIVEKHFRMVDDSAEGRSAVDRSVALEFLLQALAPLDVATRGFLDRTRRYEEQRARAETLADRDEFRSALVNSLQEGFFVADAEGAVVEINEAFTKITGYPAEETPYRWPYPWLVDAQAALRQGDRLSRDDQIRYETPIRHRDGRLVWVTANVSTVYTESANGDVYVGTIRDITAERAFAARESAVLRLATAVAVAKNMADVLSITLDECRTAIGVSRVVGATWSPDGGDPAIQVAGEPAATTWRDIDPLLQRTFTEARRQLPLTVQPVEAATTPGASSGIVAVLSSGGDVVLWLELRTPRRISAEERLLVTVLVGHLSLAIQHVRQFEAARETSLTLQRAMLPPMDPPAGFAVRYEPAVSPLQIGGDWYDVLPLGDHRIGVIVGDCVGRGLAAAAVMGQLRSSARALLLTGADPAMVLEQLDSVAEFIPDAFCSTVFLATLDTESGVLCYSSAGHLPAVLAAPHCGAVLLSEAQSVPLAVQRKSSRSQATVNLIPGSTLMLYTDGLVERRNVGIDDGIARVAAVVASRLNVPVEDVADAALAELMPPGGYDDDVAIVVYRRPFPALSIDMAATAPELAVLRRQLDAWLRDVAVPEILAADVVLSVSEACANSIEHGYRGHRPGTVRVEAHCDGARVQVRIVDSGSWKPAPAVSANRGRGLQLIRAVSDWINLDCTPSGTTVELTFRIPADSAVHQMTM